jgi:hypothetical protein
VFTFFILEVFFKEVDLVVLLETYFCFVLEFFDRRVEVSFFLYSLLVSWSFSYFCSIYLLRPSSFLMLHSLLLSLHSFSVDQLFWQFRHIVKCYEVRVTFLVFPSSLFRWFLVKIETMHWHFCVCEVAEFTIFSSFLLVSVVFSHLNVTFYIYYIPTSIQYLLSHIQIISYIYQYLYEFIYCKSINASSFRLYFLSDI